MMANANSTATIYTAAELDFLTRDHPLARLATVGADGTPHVMPVGMYTVDPMTGVITTSGHDLPATKKWRDVTRSGRGSIVVDDVLPPFRPRGIEIRGRAETVVGDEPVIRIVPERIVAWGLDAAAGRLRNARSVPK